MKGFYFSLDALTASMVLMALIAMLATFTPETNTEKKPYQLDYIQTASVQSAEAWNSSLPGNETVLQYIHEQHLTGNSSEVTETCNSYFSFSPGYALFFSDQEEMEKVCGGISVSDEQNLAINRVLLPDRKINGAFHGPVTATLVIKDE